MGHKVHPYGFRLGIIREWQTRWFADKPAVYRANLLEDVKIRDLILKRHKDAAVAKVEIDRKASEVRATIHSARPGVVIGRGGQRVEELRKELEAATGKRVRVDIHEIRQPELEAPLIAQSIADQIERHISFRRAAKQAVSRSMQAGAQGVKVLVAGRLGGAEIARREKAMAGRVPLHTLRADIDFGQAEARTQMGQIGIKVWVYRGDIISELTTAEEARRRGLLGGIEPTKTAADDSQEAGQTAAVEAPAAAAAEASPPTSSTDTEQQDQGDPAVDETGAEDD
jgi:small subunit ribosomal protein S3